MAKTSMRAKGYIWAVGDLNLNFYGGVNVKHAIKLKSRLDDDISWYRRNIFVVTHYICQKTQKLFQLQLERTIERICITEIEENGIICLLVIQETRESTPRLLKMRQLPCVIIFHLQNQHIWWLSETSNIEQVGKLTDHKCHGLFVRLEQPKKLAFFMTFEKLPNNLVA